MSTIQANNVSDGTTTVSTEYVVNGSAKAHANWDNASTLTDTLNVSSGTDNGTGNARLNLTNDMSSGTYIFNGVCLGAANTTAAVYEGTTSYSASRVDYNTTVHTSGSTTISLNDFDSLTVVHGDLA